MGRNVFVAGVGMTPFRAPGMSDPFDVMGANAVREALTDAGIDYADVQQVFAGHAHGASTSGQTVLYRVGMTGIPVVNVSNGCASGASALFLARQAVRYGALDCALVVGFEQMSVDAADANDIAAQYGRAAVAHMQKYGTRLETFASIRAKASLHAARNPLAMLRGIVSTDDVMRSRMSFDGAMTRAMLSQPASGAAAAVIVSEAFARRRDLRMDVAIAAQALTTDTPGTYDTRDVICAVGFDMTRAAAARAFDEAGIGPDDIDVIELHDNCAQNELLSYEALGLCAKGAGERLVNAADNTFGGRWVVNPSGGLLARGHPPGATGLAQCHELTQQLRGRADARQVDGARTALAHNIGLGGACVVTIFTTC